MERVVDGPQAASWAPGLQTALDLRGQRIEVILKPTTSVYAPFYLSSRGYGLFVDVPTAVTFHLGSRSNRTFTIEAAGPELDFSAPHGRG